MKYTRTEKDKSYKSALIHLTIIQQNGISHEDVNWIKIDVEGAEIEERKGV